MGGLEAQLGQQDNKKSELIFAQEAPLVHTVAIEYRIPSVRILALRVAASESF